MSTELAKQVEQVVEKLKSYFDQLGSEPDKMIVCREFPNTNKTEYVIRYKSSLGFVTIRVIETISKFGKCLSVLPNALLPKSFRSAYSVEYKGANNMHLFSIIKFVKDTDANIASTKPQASLLAWQEFYQEVMKG